MPKPVWDARETRDVQESDGYAVMIQRRSVSFWIENEWRTILANYWAWVFVVREQKAWGDVNGLGVWVPKLLPFRNDSTLRNQLEPLPSRPTPSYTNCTRLGGTDLPPELFRYICQGAGGRSTSFRLVCKYWEQQCRPFVFAEITVQRSPQRVLHLMDLIKDLTCRILPHIKTIGWIPFYTTMSEFPFLHLLGQTGIPSRVVTVEGPFRKGHRTMRSIHFAVPRTLPSCFSRGITSLDLAHIHFQRPEDLMSLISELPDLEEVSCGRMWGNMMVTFGSDPTEHLPRRPRKSRNNLKHVRITKTPAEDDKELRPGYARFALYPFMAVYDSASFFDDNQVAVICALLLFKKFDDRYNMYLDGNYEYDAETNSRLFQFGRHFVACGIEFALRTRPDSAIIYYNMTELTADTVGWRQVAAACRSLSRPPQFVVGVHDRDSLLDFNTNVVEKMPSLFKPGVVHYSFLRPGHQDKWFLTSLDPDKLEGEGKDALIDVYP